MSWSYSGNPNDSEIDRYRFLIGDTDESAPIMQDEEIQFLIDQYGSNENRLRQMLFSHAATIFARDIKRSLGPQSEDPTERLRYFKEQAEIYKAALKSAGITMAEQAYPKIFRKGMQNNTPWPALRGVDYVQ